MISDFIGIFEFTHSSIQRNAPHDMGVYYCGIPGKGVLHTNYVGRAKGEYENIRDRLYDHLRMSDWNNVTYFGYRICTTEKEAEELEDKEILRLQPVNNIYGKKEPCRKSNGN